MHTKTFLSSLAITLFPAAAAAQTAPPVVPVLDGATRAQVLAILSSPAGSVNYRDAFAKIGDSITESGSFLKDVGCMRPPDPAFYGAYAGLVATVSYFQSRTYGAGYTDAWCGVPDSFTRASVASMSGMTSTFAFSSTSVCPSPFTTVLRCEYYRMRPSYALIMFGTNDVMANVNATLVDALARYRANMQNIVAQSITDGVVPVLSTIPPLLRTSEVTQAMVDRVASYNQVVIDVAAANSVPLWNYNRSLVELGAGDNYGVSSDGIHPSIYRGSDGANFTAAALHYGYNVRNLGAIQVLDALRAVAGGSAPPPPPPPPSTSSSRRATRATAATSPSATSAGSEKDSAGQLCYGPR